MNKTDTRMLLETLEQASRIISFYASSTKEANVARKCRLLRKKIKKKQDDDRLQQLKDETMQHYKNKVIDEQLAQIAEIAPDIVIIEGV